MTKITSISVFRHNGQGTDPTALGQVSDLTNFGFFQRPAVKEMLTFVSRTIVMRTQPGQRQSVEHEDFVGHVCVTKDSLAAIVFVDKEYPARSAFCVVNKVLDDFQESFGASWKTVTGDSSMGNELMEPSLAKYQDPAQADKLMKIQKELDETKVILHKTIDSVLERGEKLDSLVDKSSDLSMASQMFYKQAKKQNQCCTFM